MKVDKLRWCEKYELALSEALSIKEIMQLRDCGQPKAIEIRNKVIDYCLLHNICFETRKVPTSVVFTVTNLDLEYYYNKMLQESRCLKFSEV